MDEPGKELKGRKVVVTGATGFVGGALARRLATECGAQVVGAGYIISDQSGEISTLVKLIRVACLVPVVVIISLITHRSRADSPDKRPLLPWFLVAFVAMVIVNSAGWIPPQAHELLTPISSWCLLTAVAALGVKTSLKALTEVGPAPVGVMVLQTLLLAALVIGGIALIR